MSVLIAGARRVLLGTAFPSISLSNSIVLVTATVGTVVGTLGIRGHAVGTPSFSLVDDAGGKYALVGSDIQVAAALAVGIDSIEVSVSGLTPAPLNRIFSIIVLPVNQWNSDWWWW